MARTARSGPAPSASAAPSDEDASAAPSSLLAANPAAAVPRGTSVEEMSAGNRAAWSLLEEASVMQDEALAFHAHADTALDFEGRVHELKDGSPLPSAAARKGKKPAAAASCPPVPDDLGVLAGDVGGGDGQLARASAALAERCVDAPGGGAISGFYALFLRRAQVLRRVSDVARHEVSAPAPAAAEPSPSDARAPAPGSAALRMAVLALFPMLEAAAERDPSVRSGVSASLLAALRGLPLLSLDAEADDCLRSFRGLLRPVALSSEDDGERAGAAAALFGLAAHSGGLLHLAEAVHLMLRLPDASGPGVAVAPVLARLAEHRRDRDNAAPRRASYSGSWQHASPDMERLVASRRSSRAPGAGSTDSATRRALMRLGGPGGGGGGGGGGGSFGSAPAPDKGASGPAAMPPAGGVASDGAFLYVYNRHGLQRVGSGLGGTLRGHVYASNAAFDPLANAEAPPGSKEEKRDGEGDSGGGAPPPKPGQERGSLVFVSGRLFFASPAFFAARGGRGGGSLRLLLEIDCDTLEPAGFLSVQLDGGRAHVPFYRAIASDGRLVYALYAEGEESAESERAIDPAAEARLVDVYRLEGDCPRLERSFELWRRGGDQSPDADAEEEQFAASSPFGGGRGGRSSSRHAAALLWTMFCTAPDGRLVVVRQPAAEVSSSALAGQLGAGAGAGGAAERLMHYRPASSLRQDVYEAATGEHVARVRASSTSGRAAEPRCVALCYDGRAAAVWGYDPDSLTVHRWEDLTAASAPLPADEYLDLAGRYAPPGADAAGPAAVDDDSDSGSDAGSLGGAWDDAEQAGEGPARPVPGPAAAAIALHHMARVGESSRAGATGRARTDVPLCVELSKPALRALLAVVRECVRALSPGGAPEGATAGGDAARARALRSALLLLAQNLERGFPGGGARPAMDLGRGSLLRDLRDTLLGLASADSFGWRTAGWVEPVREAAVRGLVAGLPAFFADPAEALALVHPAMAGPASSGASRRTRRSRRGGAEAAGSFFEGCARERRPCLARASRAAFLAHPALLEALAGRHRAVLAAALAAGPAEAAAPGGVLDALLARAEDELQLSVASGGDAAAAAAAATPLVSPTLRLLLTLQRLVFATCEAQVAASYASRLAAGCAAALEAGQASEAALRSSPVGLLLPAAVHALAGLAEAGPAEELLGRLGALLRSLPAVPREALAAGGADSRTVKANEMETKHPYDHNSARNTVRMPGARFMLVLFDSRCCTASSADSLLVCDGRGSPVSRALSGPPSAWPRTPLVVAGDTVTVVWTVESRGGGGGARRSAAARRRWGFRLLVQGFTAPSAVRLGWQADLACSVAVLARGVARRLVFEGAPGGEDARVASWLDSDLFAGGRAAAGGGFVSDLLDDNTDSAAVEMHRRMSAAVPNRPMLSAASRGPAERCERATVAALLHHTGLAAEAARAAENQPFDASAPGLAPLRRVWERAARHAGSLVYAGRLLQRWHAAVACRSLDDLSSAGPRDLAALCELTGAAFDAADPKVTVARLQSRLDEDADAVARRLVETGAAADAADAAARFEELAGPLDELSPARAYGEVASRVEARARLLCSLAVVQRAPQSQPPTPVLRPAASSSAVRRSPSAASAAPAAADGGATDSGDESEDGDLRLGRTWSAHRGRRPDAPVAADALSPSASAVSVERREQRPPADAEAAADDGDATAVQSSFQRWRAWQRTETPGSAPPPAAAAAAASSSAHRARQVVAFMTPGVAASAFESAAKARSARARSRAAGMDALCDMLDAAGSDAPRGALLYGLGDGMRRHWRRPGSPEGPSYACGLGGCAPADGAQLGASFARLLGRLVAVFSDAGAHPSVRLLAMDAVGMCYSPDRDMSVLAESGLFPALRAIMSRDGGADVSLRASARRLFSLLATQCLWWRHAGEAAPAVAAAATSLARFQKVVFHDLFGELESEIRGFLQACSPSAPSARRRPPDEGKERECKDDTEEEEEEEEERKEKKKSGDNDDAGAASALAPTLPQDDACYELLVLVYRLRSSPAGRRFLSRHESVSSLLRLLTNGTLRLQRLTLRLLRYMLTDPGIAAFVSGGGRRGGSRRSSADSSGGGAGGTPRRARAKPGRRAASLVRDLLLRIGELASGASSSAAAAAPAEPSPAPERDTPPSSPGHPPPAHPPRLGRVPSMMRSSSSSSVVSSRAAAERLRREEERSARYALRVFNTAAGGAGAPAFVNLMLALAKETLTSIHVIRRKVGGDLMSDLRKQLAASEAAGDEQPSAVLHTGKRDECVRMARDLAKRGFCVSVVPKPPDDGARRNQHLALSNPAYYCSGHVSLALVSELLSVVRALSRHEQWAAAVAEAAAAGIAAMPAAAEALAASAAGGGPWSDDTLASAPLAVLAVLGGFREATRLGGRVLVAVDEERGGAARAGTVVRWERGRRHASVLFDGDSQPTETAAESLVPVADAAASSSLVAALGERLLEPVVRFLEMTGPGEAAGDAAAAGGSELARLVADLRLRAVMAVGELAEQPRAAQALVRLPSAARLAAALGRMATRCEASATLTSLDEAYMRMTERFLDLRRPPIRAFGPGAEAAAAAAAAAEAAAADAAAGHDMGRALPHLPGASAARRLSVGAALADARYVIWEDAARTTVHFTRSKRQRRGGPPPQQGGSGGGLFGGGGPRMGGGRSSALRAGDTDLEFVLRGNAPVPATMALYYFEVELLEACSVSVGLAPRSSSGREARSLLAALEQEQANRPSRGGFGGGRGGAPDMQSHALAEMHAHGQGPVWSRGSMRYEGRSGRVVRVDRGQLPDARETEAPAGEPFGARGDVIGCGWDLRTRGVFFTKNGRRLAGAGGAPASFADADPAADLFPAAGMADPGTRVRLNFGQRPFVYALPEAAGGDEEESEEAREERLRRAREVEERRKAEEQEERERQEAQRVAREVERLETAQQIVAICGGQCPDVEHATKALELHQDKLEVAVSWLLDNPGAPEQLARAVARDRRAAAAAAAAEEPSAAPSAAPVAGGKDAAGGDGDGRHSSPSSSSSSSSSSAAVPAAAAAAASARASSPDAAAAAPAPAAYDPKRSSGVVLGNGYPRPPDPDDAVNQVDPAEVSWLAEIQTLLRRSGVDAATTRALMNQLRQGGQARANAVLMLPDVLPNVPQLKQSDASSSSAAAAERLEPVRWSEMRVGLRVLVRADTAAAAAAAAAEAGAASTAGPRAAEAAALSPGEDFVANAAVGALARRDPSKQSSAAAAPPSASPSSVAAAAMPYGGASGLSGRFGSASVPSMPGRRAGGSGLGQAQQQKQPPGAAPAGPEAVSALWVRGMGGAVGAVGVIRQVDAEARLVRVQFDSPETSSTAEWWFTADAIAHVAKAQRDSFIGLERMDDVRGPAAASAGERLANVFARRAVLSMVGHWPRAAGAAGELGPGGLLDLASVEYLRAYQSPGGGPQQQQDSAAESGPVAALPAVMGQLFERALRDDPGLVADTLGRAAAVVRAETVRVRLSERDEAGRKALAGMRESGSVPVRVRSASSVVVTFGADCALPEAETAVLFYGNAACTRLLRRYNGVVRAGRHMLDTVESEQMRPFVAQASELWVTLSGGADAADGGGGGGGGGGAATVSPVVSLEVSPVPPQLALAHWMIDFVTVRFLAATLGGGGSDGDSEEWAERLQAAAEAFGRFLCTPGLAPTLCVPVFRAVARAVRALASHPASLAGRLPDAGALQLPGLLAELKGLVRSEARGGNSLFSVYTQGLAELLRVARAAYGEEAYASWAAPASSPGPRMKRQTFSFGSPSPISAAPPPGNDGLLFSFFALAAPPSQGDAAPPAAAAADAAAVSSDDSESEAAAAAAEGASEEEEEEDDEEDVDGDGEGDDEDDEEVGQLMSMGFSAAASRRALGMFPFEVALNALLTGQILAEEEEEEEEDDDDDDDEEEEEPAESPAPAPAPAPASASAPSPASAPAPSPERKQQEEKSEEAPSPSSPAEAFEPFDTLCAVSAVLRAVALREPLPPAFVARAFSSGVRAGPAGAAEDASEAAAAAREHRAWTLDADLQAASLLRSLELARADSSALSRRVTPDDLSAAGAALRALPAAASSDRARLCRRLSVLQALNRLMADALPLVELALATDPVTSALAAEAAAWAGLAGGAVPAPLRLALMGAGERVSYLRGLLASSVRGGFFASVVDRTSVRAKRGSPRVVIDRIVAANARDAVGRNAATVARNSVFGQAFRQLRDTHPLLLRPPRPHGANPHIAFEVKFRGEHAVGEGGPYRQFFTDACQELQEVRHDASPSSEAGAAAAAAQVQEGSAPAGAASASSGPAAAAAAAAAPSSGPAPAYTLPLLVRCPNSQAGVGDNRDKYVLRPSARSAAHLAMFEHLGRLMGMALRTNILMPLDLAQWFWKPLAGLPVDEGDLRAVDLSFKSGVLDNLRACRTEEEFAASFRGSLHWEVTLSDRSRLELRPGGRRQPVTFADRHEFLREARAARLCEAAPQAAAVRRGLCQIVPEQLLSLFTAAGLEGAVCGRPHVDVGLLRRHTEYSGVSADAPHIGWFWGVLESWSQDERRRFVKFAWAQERLPSTDEDFQRGGQRIRMLIKSRSGPPGESPDSRFPKADTCFFNLELPAYTSEAVMRDKLNIVINISSGMDGDDGGADVGAFGVLSEDEEDDFAEEVAEEMEAYRQYYVGGAGDDEEEEEEFDDDDDEEEGDDDEGDDDDDEDDDNYPYDE